MGGRQRAAGGRRQAAEGPQKGGLWRKSYGSCSRKKTKIEPRGRWPARRRSHERETTVDDDCSCCPGGLCGPVPGRGGDDKIPAGPVHHQGGSYPGWGCPDHIIGIYDQTGLASFDTGEVASLKNPGTLDYIKGSGTIQGYTVLTFEDGSTMTTKYQGTTRPDSSGKGSRWESTWTYTQGTGRWAGIQGGGTSTGRRFVPFGGGVQLYSDITGTYTLPSR